MMSDAKALNGVSIDRHSETGVPTLFIYDSADGGLESSRAIYETNESLCRRTRELVASCSCGLRGCPSCVMDHMCGDDNWPMHTEAAADLLAAVVDGLNLTPAETGTTVLPDINPVAGTGSPRFQSWEASRVANVLIGEMLEDTTKREKLITSVLNL